VVNSTVCHFGSVAWESGNLTLTRTLTNKKQFYKHNSSSFYQNWTYDVSYERSQRKDHLRLMVNCACELLPIRPKSQNFNIRHDGTLSIRNLMLMLKNWWIPIWNLYAPWVQWPWSGQNPKIQVCQMVLFRSENWYWIRHN
jgi:hypothetical protein